MSKALILIDLQNDYFESGAMPLVGAEQASLNAQQLLKQFRAHKQAVVHIQHVSSRPEATFFLPETNGVAIHDHVKPMADEKVIVKHFPNSFRETDLLDHLQSLAISDVVICGMMTHMCVDATTRAAKDYGFNIEVIGDACATRDLEINGQAVVARDVHNSFLAALNYFYSSVKTTNDFLAKRL